ncbi:hypothetical protein [Streptomyces sp. AC495_CC817]|uniref:hypothetical protein n=1 Tax=Streptomyces sp. AC495_CC817 TaxID=2823900 RepID=UPI001C253AED|nr:hypothetical protein [Streptomyces sp. AC495_CC817]
MAMPNIEDIIPEGPIRKRVFQAGAILGGVLFLTQVGFVAAQVATPTWLTVALAVYAPLAAAGFAKAQSNVPLVPVAPVGQLAQVSRHEPWSPEERAEALAQAEARDALERDLQNP